jgi:undecaprenyl-diphosphatase
MDWSIVHSLNAFLARTDALEDPLTAYVRASEALFLAMLVLVILLARHPTHAGTRRAAVAAGLSAGLGLLVVKLLTEFVHRPRPFVAHPGVIHMFLAHAADSSFPSDHATASVAVAAAILLRGRATWGAVTLAFAFLIMFGRVALGLHYPTDVIGGALIGATCAVLLWLHPLREAVDALADTLGSVWDRGTDGVAQRVSRAKLIRGR